MVSTTGYMLVICTSVIGAYYLSLGLNLAFKEYYEVAGDFVNSVIFLTSFALFVAVGKFIQCKLKYHIIKDDLEQPLMMEEPDPEPFQAYGDWGSTSMAGRAFSLIRKGSIV